ncbi:LCP family protein [Nocardioides sp. CFH 31398]|uniref:LCP family protein n=1 Tax=Nocardioides sp. CFH 31398 TaxID=2919579 RepID=UPI001F05BF7B|nr:LCP family protein [Nocardioides sp. CFH 31398]MCH1866423.1 LCP family protein [Nocardioides sp. CFH 31398]
MADRPEGGGQGPQRGTPEYDWLYGTSTAPGSGDGAPQGGGTAPRPAQPSSQPSGQPSSQASTGPDDEATQVFRPQSGGAPPPASPPQQPAGRDPYDLYGPPGGSQGGSQGVGSTQSMPAVGRGGEPPSRRPAPAPAPARAPQPRTQRTRRGFRFRPRYLVLLLVAWLVFLVAVPIIAYFRIDRIDAFGDDRLDSQPGTNYLLVGSDSREDLSEEERQELGTGDAAGRRTDTIMLLHVGSGPNLLMSIPRDSIVDIPGEGTNKINAAFAIGGPELLVDTVESNTGIRIDHFVEIGFGGFVNIIDGVGGIEICPDQAIDDPLANLDIRRGCQEVDGTEALGYARTRKFATSDIQRAENQREVVSAVGAKVFSPWSVLNPLRWWRLNIAAAGSLRVSDGTGPFALGRFAFAMTRVDGENGLTCGVPIADLEVNWDAERSEEMFNRIRNDETERIGRQLCTPSGLEGQ